MVKKLSSKLKFGIGILLLILFLVIGGTYAFLSQETLIRLGIDLGLSSLILKIIGFSLIGLGIVAFLVTLLTDVLRKVDKIGRRYWYLFLFFDIFKWIIIVVLGLILLSGGVQITQSVI